MTLKIEQVPVENLTFDPSNARKHSDANLASIAQSLNQFGQRKPIVVTADNVIVAGNGTVEAARMVGLTAVDVVRVPKGWTADQVKAFALADNRSAELAEWNPEVLSAQLLELQDAGFDVEALGFDIVAEEVNPVDSEKDDVIAEAPQRASVGDHWRIGQHEVICGDSSDPKVIAGFATDFDAVITDPPYGIGANNQTLGNGKKKFHRGEGWDDKVLDIRFVLDLAPLQIIWGGNYFTDQLPPNNHWLIWYKKIANVSFSECEMAWTNLGKQVRLFSHHWSGEEKQHVTMKPSPVMDWCCSFVPKQAKIVDVYAGSGSTLLAAHRNNQIGYGVELDPIYVDVILNRLEILTGEKAVLINASR
jgi:DNA modification methylase